jgi:transcriptional regulator with XRE-family HTH domain
MESAVKPPWRVEFGKRIRASRHAAGWTQEHLAEVAGMHPTYVGDTERGERNISLDGILRLSKALGVRPGELLDGLEGQIKLPK